MAYFDAREGAVNSALARERLCKRDVVDVVVLMIYLFIAVATVDSYAFREDGVALWWMQEAVAQTERGMHS